MSRPETLLAYLLDTAQDLLDTTSPESRTDRADVIAQWLYTLLTAQAPDAEARRIALTDPDTGEAIEVIATSAWLEITVGLDGEDHTARRLLVRRNLA